MNARVRVHFTDDRRGKSELEQHRVISVPAIHGSSVQQTSPTPGWFRFRDSRQQPLLIAHQFVLSHKSALLPGPSLALQRCFPLLHCCTESAFRPCQLLASSSKKWSKAINSNSLHAGKLSQETGKRNVVLTPVWDVATKLETFSPFQGPAHTSK